MCLFCLRFVFLIYPGMVSPFLRACCGSGGRYNGIILFVLLYQRGGVLESGLEPLKPFKAYYCLSLLFISFFTLNRLRLFIDVSAFPAPTVLPSLPQTPHFLSSVK